jgi:DNA polymerase I
MKGSLLDVDYAEEEEQPCVRLFIKDGSEMVMAIDPSFEQYLYVVASDPNKTAKLISKLELTERGQMVRPKSVKVVRRTFLGREVEAIKVSFHHPKDIPPLRHAIRDFPGVKEIYEFDIPSARRYLVDRGLTPMAGVEVRGDVKEREGLKTVLIKAPLEPVPVPEPKLNVMSFDIEVYNPTGSPRPDKDPILMVSLADNRGFRKVITWKDLGAKLDYVEILNSEREMLERFVELVREKDVDILLGYNTDLFDFPYIRERARQLRLKLNLGRDGSEVIARKRRFATAARVRGRVHVDVFAMVNFLATIGTIRLIHYTLEDVYRHVIGKEKPDFEFTQMVSAWEKGGELGRRLLEYSMSDADATLELGLELLPLFVELTRVVGQTLFDVSRMTPGQLVEWLLIAEAHRRGELIPARPVGEEFEDRLEETYVGAYVMEPVKGLHEDLVVYDFRSLYPSIIVTHNIDPSTLNCKCCKPSEAMRVPELGYHFCTKRKGFIPSTLERLIRERVRLKEEMKQHKRGSKEYLALNARQTAFKIISNAFYGMLGYPRARWYFKECAESVTSFGRHYIHRTIEMAKDNGLEVIYGDSLPHDRRIFVRDTGGDVYLMKIGEFVEKYGGKAGKFETLSLDLKNEELRFMPIKRAIRHYYDEKKKGKLLEITTKYGKTVVTQQHSVYAYRDGIRLVDAKELKIGDYLISLTNPPQYSKYREGDIIDAARLNFGPYAEQLYVYKDSLHFPDKTKGACPYCGEEYANLSGHVSASHSERKKPLNPLPNKEYCFIGGKNAKTGRIPRFWKLTKELAWVLGYYCAEGSVSDVKTKKGRKHLVSFGSQDLNQIKRVKSFFDGVLGDDLRIIKNFDKRTGKYMYYYRVNRIPLLALFQYGFGAGKGSASKTVPPFIFASEREIRNAFLAGYLAGDGSSKVARRYVTKFIQCDTKSKDLAIGIHFILKSLDGGVTSFGKRIRHVYWKYRKDKPEISTLRFQSTKSPQLEGKNHCLAEIVKISEFPLQKKYVYDLEVEGTHNFVDAEGLILVHNTDSLFCKLNGKSREDATKFMEKINESLPGIMELELEGFYPRGIFITKKRYAMIDEEERMVVKGLEFVRRDWAAIAKRTQEEVLKAILRDGSPEKAAEIVRRTTKDVLEGKVNLEDLIIYTQLKMPIESYRAIGPHVVAAKRLRELGHEVEPGMMIAYIEVKGPGSISDRAVPVEDFKGKEYDPDYYVGHQVLPAVMRIMEVLGYREEDLRFERKKQLGIEKFMS